MLLDLSFWRHSLRLSRDQQAFLWACKPAGTTPVFCYSRTLYHLPAVARVTAATGPSALLWWTTSSCTSRMWKIRVWMRHLRAVALTGSHTNIFLCTKAAYSLLQHSCWATTIISIKSNYYFSERT